MTFWVAGAAVVGGIGGAVVSSNAAGKAANTQAAGTAAANAETQREFDKLQENQQPYLTSGRSALEQYNNLLGITTPAGSDKSEANFNSEKYLALNPDANEYMRTSGKSAYQHYLEDGARRTGDFWNSTQGFGGNPSSPEFGSYAKPLTAGEVQLDPGYQFGLQQGQEGIDRKTAAAGGRISGAALKAASEYNTNYATTGYSTAYNRVNQARTDRLNRLAALAGIGQTSAQQVGQAGMNAATVIGNNTTAQGNAAAAGQIAQGNIWAGAGNQLAALYGRSTGMGSSGFGSYGGSGPVNMGTATGGDMSTFYG